MAKIKRNGKTIASVPVGSVEAVLSEEGGEGLTVEYSQHEQRAIVRANIAAKAGDVSSLLGTTSDAAALAVFGLASLVEKLSEATSLADVRAAAEPFAALSADFLAKVQEGSVKLPFMAKGVDATIADIEARATAVTDALASPE